MSTHDKKIAELYAEYQRRLRENNALDFDDLLTVTVRLLKENAEARDKYQRRFRYILVDEYQDTNEVQYELTKSIIINSVLSDINDNKVNDVSLSNSTISIDFDGQQDKVLKVYKNSTDNLYYICYEYALFAL